MKNKLIIMLLSLSFTTQFFGMDKKKFPLIMIKDNLRDIEADKNTATTEECCCIFCFKEYCLKEYIQVQLDSFEFWLGVAQFSKYAKAADFKDN
jgi:hypothetical protein